jgi:hypothetical protein
MRIVTLLTAAGFTCAALPAHAGVCTKEIEMVTKLLSGGGSPSVGSAASAVPSTNSAGALSAVTGGGGAGALGSGAAASPEALTSVKQAQAADAAGDETSCMEYISKAKELLGLVQ